MNENLINKISELMQVSYDKAIELYPILRTQFLWYELLENIKKFIGMLCILEIAFLIFIIWVEGIDYKFNRKYTLDFRILKYTLYSLVITIFIGVIVLVCNILLAPDIVFVKGLLGGK